MRKRLVGIDDVAIVNAMLASATQSRHLLDLPIGVPAAIYGDDGSRVQPTRGGAQAGRAAPQETAQAGRRPAGTGGANWRAGLLLREVLLKGGTLDARDGVGSGGLNVLDQLCHRAIEGQAVGVLKRLWISLAAADELEDAAHARDGVRDALAGPQVLDEVDADHLHVGLLPAPLFVGENDLRFL